MNGRTMSIIASLIPHWAIFPMNNPKQEEEDDRSLRSFVPDTHLLRISSSRWSSSKKNRRDWKETLISQSSLKGCLLTRTDSSTSKTQRRKNASLGRLRWGATSLVIRKDGSYSTNGKSHLSVNGELFAWPARWHMESDRRVLVWASLRRSMEAMNWYSVRFE